jgi:nucleoporin NUP42
MWPLSAYGPGRDAPRQLLEGGIDISPEEMRMKFYGKRAAGNESAAVSFLSSNV